MVAQRLTITRYYNQYCIRLSGFQALDYPDESIDIPGQYTGASPPTQVATIQRFDQRLLVMSSIRKPKRLSILGSDEKEHLFLVKVYICTISLQLTFHVVQRSMLLLMLTFAVSA